MSDSRTRRSRVAILRTSPATVLADYHELVNLAGYQEELPKDVETALKIHRPNEPNILLLKDNVKYMYKENEDKGGDLD